MKINIHGSIFGIDGYSHHTRSLANALYKVADCKLSTQLPQNWMQQVNDAELDMIMKPERLEDWNVIVTIPHMWKLFLGQGKNACYCVWEGDRVPDSWIEEFENPRVDLILVPSQHTYDAIMTTWHQFYDDKAIEEKLRIIPHGVNREIFYNTDNEPTDKYVDKSIFKFICNKGWRGTSWDRGGVQYVIKAFAEEFNKDENVKLEIVLNPSYINPQILQQAIQQLNLPENRAPIHIACDVFTPQQIAKIYNECDCYVCATRAEAFNLPGLEAMSCGLPTIQTAFGGQIDYMNLNNSQFVEYSLVESEEIPAYEGIQWALPDIEYLKRNMRWAFENKEKIKEMGKQAEEDSKKFTWELSAKKIIEILK